jgi:hypothetical protein
VLDPPERVRNAGVITERRSRVRGWFPLAVGLLLVVIGALWAVQGLGYLGGSMMSDVRLWAIIGPVLSLGGLVLIAAGLRRRRR